MGGGGAQRGNDSDAAPPRLRAAAHSASPLNPPSTHSHHTLGMLLQTFAEMDLTRDGVINPEEWMALVHRNPGGWVGGGWVGG